MNKNILNLEGVKIIEKKAQRQVNGGHGCHCGGAGNTIPLHCHCQADD